MTGLSLPVDLNCGFHAVVGQRKCFYLLAFLTLASHTNEQLSVCHLHVYFMPCSVKIKIGPLVTHFKI